MLPIVMIPGSGNRTAGGGGITGGYGVITVECAIYIFVFLHISRFTDLEITKYYLINVGGGGVVLYSYFFSAQKN